MMTQRALNLEDKALFRLMTKRVAVSLRDYRDKGVLRCSIAPGCTIFGKSQRTEASLRSRVERRFRASSVGRLSPEKLLLRYGTLGLRGP